MTSSRAEHDRQVIEGADSFCATAHRGRARYDTVQVPTLEEARAAAARLHADRPVMIYAIRGNCQVHVENWPAR